MNLPSAITLSLIFALGACRSGDVDLGEGRRDAGMRIGPYDECGNGMDDDGDGQNDEGCPCGAGEMQSCFSGDYPFRAVGACQDGTQQCDVQGANEFGFWGSCGGDRLPAEERCDGSDADCDGAIDEGCPCTAGETHPCGAEFIHAPCTAGVQTCSVTGEWSGCEGAVGPSAEVCGDDIDNDCDGTPDERCDCIPEPERCGDDIDNDCDGVVDEPDGCTPRMDAGVPDAGLQDAGLDAMDAAVVDAGTPVCSGMCTPGDWRDIGATVTDTSTMGGAALGACATPEGGAVTVIKDGADLRMTYFNGAGVAERTERLGVTLETGSLLRHDIATHMVCLPGRFVLAYRDGDRRLVLQSFDYDGTPSAGPVVVADDGTRFPASLAHLGNEIYVAWAGYDGDGMGGAPPIRLLSRRFNESLEALGDPVILTPEHEVAPGYAVEAEVRASDVVVTAKVFARTVNQQQLVVGVRGDATTFVSVVTLTTTEDGDSTDLYRHLAVLDDGPMALCYMSQPFPCCLEGQQMRCQFLSATGELMGSAETLTARGSEGFDFGMVTDGCRFYVSSYCRTLTGAECTDGGYLYVGDPATRTWEQVNLPSRPRSDTILGFLPLSAELLRVGTDLWHFGLERSNTRGTMQLHDLRLGCAP